MIEEIKDKGFSVRAGTRYRQTGGDLVVIDWNGTWFRFPDESAAYAAGFRFPSEGEPEGQKSSKKGQVKIVKSNVQQCGLDLEP